MCNHSYAAVTAKSPGGMGKRCPYPDFFKSIQTIGSTPADADPIPDLPLDDSGACIFHSRDVEWKRRNDFTARFLKLVELLNADKTLKQYDFVDFVFVGASRTTGDPRGPFFFRVTDTIFRKQAYFVGASFLDSVVFQGLDFKEGADFRDATFANDLSIASSRISGLEMSRAKLNQGASFTALVLPSYAMFDDARFAGTAGGHKVQFKDSQFEGITSFAGAGFAAGDQSSVGFLQTRFEDFLDFTKTAFQCQVVFRDVSFGGRTDFTDTLFGVVNSAARYRGSAVEFNQIEVTKTAEIFFVSTDPLNKLFQHDVQMTFKEEPLGLIQFQNVNFNQIGDVSRKELHRLATTGRVIIGPGCEKYRFRTETRILPVNEGNAPLVIELCSTFSNYFTVSNGFNLGFEVVDRGKTELRFFYFTDENITEAEFFERLARTERRLWDLVSTRPDLRVLGSQPSSRKTSASQESAVVNAVDAISGLVRIGFGAAIRVATNTWGKADTKALLSAIRFGGDDEDADMRAESFHQALLRNYTIVALADINARQHAGLLPMQQTPLTVLFLGSNPAGTAKLGVQKEAQQIDDRVRSADLRDAFRIEQQYEVRADQLPGKIMRFKPQILHFSGHGDTSGALVFQDADGLAVPAPKDAIARVFSLLGAGIKVVVLNACFSGAQAATIVDYVDVVIGMSREIGDRAAIAFAGAFYEALAFKQDVYTAFELAKAGIDLTNLPDGAVPQMLSRPGVDPRRLFLASGPR